MILEQFTDTSVITRGSDFALIVTDAEGDYGDDPQPSWVIGYDVIPNEVAAHKHAFSDSMKVLSLEQVNPQGCIFEVCTRNRLPGGGQYYWKTAKLYGYEDAMELLSGRAELRLLIPSTECDPQACQPCKRRTEDEAAAALLRDVFDGSFGAGLN